MSTPLQGTASAASAIARVKYTHDAMIDQLIANPGISQGQLATSFGYTQAWVSRVLNSDAFQARLAERKDELVDPVITMTLEEKFKALADLSLQVVTEKLTLSRDANIGLEALKITAKALGYGARKDNVAIQQNFVVALPGKAPSTEAWAETYAGGGQIIEGAVQH